MQGSSALADEKSGRGLPPRPLDKFQIGFRGVSIHRENPRLQAQTLHQPI